MSKSVREKGGSDPFMLGVDTPAKKNGTPKIEKTTEEKSDPFMLGVVKKKEAILPDSDITSEQDATVSQDGTKDIPQSQSPLKSEPKETNKKRYARIEEADAKALDEAYKAKLSEIDVQNSLSPFNVVGNARKRNDFLQSREGKVGKIISDINEGKFNKEDINYLVRVAPTAGKEIISEILPDSTPQNVISTDNINRFIDEGKNLVDRHNTQAKIDYYKNVESQVNSNLAELKINSEQIQNDQYANQINEGVMSQREKELESLDKQYPVEQVAKVSGRQRYYEKKRSNEGEYNAKRAEIEKKYSDIQNQVGLSKAFSYAKANPTLTPLEIGEQWLKYAQPDTHTLWVKGGKNDGVVNKRMAEVGIKALYGSGLPGTAELAKADEDTLDITYPEEIIAETYHRLGAELYKDQNWFLNAAPNVKMLDEAAKQLPEKNREVYNKFIRDRERRNFGTDVPMSGLLNKVGEGVASTATETWKGLGDFLNLRSDKKVASEALAEGQDTDFQDVGTYAPAMSRLKEIDAKKKKGEKLSPQEISEKQDLETYTGVRSTAQEIIDGTGNLTGQVLFQALGTKGLGSAASAGVKATGLLKAAPVVSGLATEEAIASSAFNFGITKEVITDVSAAAIAYASSYDAAKREAFRLMPDDEDAGKRTLYATIVGGLNAGTERIFKDEKVLSSFNKEISPSIKTLVNKLSSDGISQEALAPAITKLLKNSASFSKEMAKANLKESTEELATSVGESVATAILAPTKFNEQKAFDDAVSTFTTTFLHGGLVSGAAALNGYRANHISIPTLSKLGVDQKLTKDTKDFINGQVLSGNMTQDEANGKFKILNTAVKINTEVMPAVNEISPDLPQKAKEKYSVQLLNEKILTAQAEDTKDPVLKYALETKVKESEKIRKQILNKEIFVDDDYSVVSEAQINAVNPEDGFTPEEVVIRYAKDGKLSVYNEIVNNNPDAAIDILRDVAQQVYGITSTGDPLEGGSREGALSLQFSTDVLDAAKRKFPTLESTLQEAGESQPQSQEEKIVFPARNDDFVRDRRFFSELEEYNYHKLIDDGKEDDAKQMIDDKKKELLTKTPTNESEKTNQESGQKSSEEGSQESGSKEAVQPDVINQGAAETEGTEAAPIADDQAIKDTFENREKIETRLKEFGDDVYYHGSDDISYLNNKNDISTSKNTKNAESKYLNLTPKAGTAVSYSVKQQRLGDKSGVAAFRLKGSGYVMKMADIVSLKTNEDYEAFYDKKKLEGYDYVKVPQDANDIVVLNNDSIEYVGKKLNAESLSKTKVRVSAEQVEKGQPKTEPSKNPTRKELSDQLKNLLNGKPLALDTDPLSRLKFEEIGITTEDTIQTAIDKLIAYDGEFADIFKVIKNDPNLSNVKLEIVDKLPNNESGLYYPQGNEDGKGGLLQVSNKGNTYYTFAHELLHFLTLDSKAAEDIKESDSYKAIEDLFNYISSNKEKPVSVAGNVSTKNYGLTNVKEFMAEMFINPTFRQYVSDVYAENKDEIFKQSKLLKDSKKGGSIVDIIADLFRELFSKIFSSKDSGIPYDEQKSVIDNAVKLATDLFFGGQDVTKDQVAGEGGVLVGMGEQKAAALALPSGLDPIVNEFVKASIAQGATPEDVKGSLIDNGFTEEEAQSYIDNNQPPAPPTGEVGIDEPEEKPSGIRKALVSNQLVSSVNLNKIGDKDMLSLGRKIIDTGEVKPEVLVNTILKERVGVLSPAEVVALITYKADLDNSLRDAYKEFNIQQEAGNYASRAAVEIADLERKIHDFDVAAVITANQQSMAFRLRQYMLDRDYNVTTQIEKYKKNNNGYIPPEVEAKFRELDRELKAVKDKLDKAEKKLAEKADQDAIDNIKEDVARENAKLSITEEEIQQKIKEGVQKEIDSIHSNLSKEKQSLANKAIKALEKFQNKLRGKSYADVTGMVAIVDTGITVIKNAIKAGVAVADAVEMGIGRIKELLAKKGINTWTKEDEFRKDALDGFEAEGVSTSKKPKDKATINDDGTVSIPNDMLRDMVARGITDIEGLTDAVHEQVVNDVPDITKRQVRDYITEYGKTVNPSTDDIQKQVNQAKRVGRLLSELEDLQNRKRRNTNISARYKLSEEEKDLKRQIRALDKSIPLTDQEKEGKGKSDLSKAKERVRSRIKELEFRIANKDFAKKKKVEPAKDEELLKLEAEKGRIQNEFDTEQYKLELKQRTFWKKAEDIALELTSGLVRGLVASVDLSAGFVQGLWRLFSNPINSANAFGTMFKHLVSEKGSQEYMNKLKTSPAYNLMQASKLAIDDKSGKASAKEGLFISNWINHIWNFMAKVIALGNPTVTKFIRKINPYEASKRAFDGYVNSIRVDSFTQLAKRLEDQGYTYESNPEVFEKAADFVNTTTGRASLGGIENSSRWLNILLFAPRKVVSEVKLFTPYAFAYYAKMPAPVRKRALLNLSKFMGGFLTVNGLLWAALKDDDDDEDNFWNPNSSDFLTHKIGNKRISIAGGAKSMIVFQSRFWSKKFTDQYGNTTKLGERYGKPINSRFDLVVRFVLGKASPAISVVAKKLDEKKGMEVDDSEIIKSLAVPMWMQDLKELYKDSPAEVSVILNALAFFGANVRAVEEKPQTFSKDELKSPELKYFTDRGAEIPEGKPEKIEIKDETEGKIKKLSDYGEEKVAEFKSTRKEILIEDLKSLQETGYVYIDKFGRASTTNEDGEKEEKDLDELTESEWKNIMSILGARATQKAKKELFEQ